MRRNPHCGTAGGWAWVCLAAAMTEGQCGCGATVRVPRGHDTKKKSNTMLPAKGKVLLNQSGWMATRYCINRSTYLLQCTYEAAEDKTKVRSKGEDAKGKEARESDNTTHTKKFEKHEGFRREQGAQSPPFPLSPSDRSLDVPSLSVHSLFSRSPTTLSPLKSRKASTELSDEFGRVSSRNSARGAVTVPVKNVKGMSKRPALAP